MTFAPRLEILPPSQRRPWDELDQVPAEFGLYGGTVQQRAEAKDYLDIDAILTDGRVTLPMALSSARGIYGSSFNPQTH